MPHWLAVTIENSVESLNRVFHLLRRRHLPVDTISVCRTEDPQDLRLLIPVDPQQADPDRIRANLEKLLCVKAVEDWGERPLVIRDMALVKVRAPSEAWVEIAQLAEFYRARIVDVGPETLIVEVTGSTDKVDSCIARLQRFGVVEVTRAGPMAMIRGQAEATPADRIAEAA
ncbi:acetolactate synthase small subunit [Thermoflexus sp.]|uniref:acetolactate synthase small subunit n=1 Tax=Thermoflexus sp. TaxID=1969742 RepID=UPI0035E426C1